MPALPDQVGPPLHLGQPAVRLGQPAVRQPLDDDRHSVVITLRQAAPREVFDLVCLGYRLSARETEVATYLMQGMDTPGMARHLFVSEHIVYHHIKSIFAKTGAHSRRDLVAATA